MKYMSYGVMIYMLLALVWWTILLLQYNDDLYTSNKDVVSFASQVNQAQLSSTTTETYENLKTRHQKKRLQILGEGIVFGISLVLGMYFIQKAYNSEIAQNFRQKNFLLSITHELKSPIAATKLLAETIKKRNLSDEQKIDLCEDIITENNRLEKLISNLLLASRINNAYPYTFEKLSITPLIHQTIERIKSLHPYAKISFESQNLISLHADKESFLSLVYNIIENAVKYSPVNPTVVVDVSMKDDFSCILTISDNGIGIKQDEKQKIFKQFYRSGHEDTRSTKGTGLGLYIADRIIKAHRGSILVVDNEPSGSIFKITMPINRV